MFLISTVVDLISIGIPGSQIWRTFGTFFGLQCQYTKDLLLRQPLADKGSSGSKTLDMTEKLINGSSKY